MLKVSKREETFQIRKKCCSYRFKEDLVQKKLYKKLKWHESRLAACYERSGRMALPCSFHTSLVNKNNR